MAEGSVVDSSVDGFSSFSGNSIVVLVCYLEGEDFGSGLVVGNVVYVKCMGDMTIVFFYPIFQTCDCILLCKKGCHFSYGQDLSYTVVFCIGILSLGCIKIYLSLLAPLKMTSMLVH